MPSDDQSKGAVWAIPACLVAGAWIMLTAAGVLPMDETKLHCPKAVFFVVGLMFFAGGLAMLLKHNHYAKLVCVVLILGAFTVVSGWCGLFGDEAQINTSAGIPFLTREQNIRVARVFFTGGSVICFLMLIWTVRCFFKGDAGATKIN